MPAVEDALAVGHQRHRHHAADVPDAGVTRLLVATLHALTRRSCEPLMMCWPSSVTATAVTEHRALEGVDERPVDVVQPDLAVARALAKPNACASSGSAATQSTLLPTSKAHELAAEGEQLRGLVAKDVMLPPGSTATADTPSVCA